MAEIWLRKYKGKTASNTNAGGMVLVYKIKIFDNIDFKFSSPISPMPLPEESGQENILVKMEGNTHTVTLTWLVKNETLNQGIHNRYTSQDGHIDANTKTIFDVINWFSDEIGFIGRNLDHSYEIVVLNDVTGLNLYDMSSASIGSTSTAPVDGSGDPFDEFEDATDDQFDGKVAMSMKGYIRSIGFRTGKDEPATLRGNIEFIVGDNVAGYQGATPNEVRNFKIAAHGSDPDTKMNISWVAPRWVGNSDIIGYDIGHRALPVSGTGEYTWQFANTPSATSITITGLTANTAYSFRVAARNSDGRGTKSDPRTRTTAAS